MQNKIRRLFWLKLFNLYLRFKYITFTIYAPATRSSNPTLFMFISIIKATFNTNKHNTSVDVDIKVAKKYLTI